MQLYNLLLVCSHTAKPPTFKHALTLSLHQTLPKEGKMSPSGPLRSPQRAIHTTVRGSSHLTSAAVPRNALISCDLPSSPATSGRPEPQIPHRHGPKGDGSSLNTFARSLLSGRTAAHVNSRVSTPKHRRREIRRYGGRLVDSHALTTSITTPIFWVRSTSTWYPTRTLTFGPFWTRSQAWVPSGAHPVRDQG